MDLELSWSEYVVLLEFPLGTQVLIAYLPVLVDYLGVSYMGHQISQTKSSYELFCALIWNLCHFLPKFEFSLIHSSVSGAFLRVFHH